MAKETTNGVEHEKNQREVCGQDRNQKDQIENEATETTGPEIERESGKRSDKESDKDPEKNENEKGQARMMRKVDYATAR